MNLLYLYRTQNRKANLCPVDLVLDAENPYHQELLRRWDGGVCQGNAGADPGTLVVVMEGMQDPWVRKLLKEDILENLRGRAVAFLYDQYEDQKKKPGCLIPSLGIYMECTEMDVLRVEKYHSVLLRDQTIPVILKDSNGQIHQCTINDVQDAYTEMTHWLTKQYFARDQKIFQVKQCTDVESLELILGFSIPPEWVSW